MVTATEATKVPANGQSIIGARQQEAEAAAKLAEQIAGSYEIDSNDVAEIAADDLRRLVAEHKRVEEMRFSITRPMDEAKRAAMAAFAPYLDRIKAAELSLRTGLNRWLEQERIRVERERAEAARLEREELERLERERQQAIDAGDDEKVAEVEAAAELVMIAPAQNVAEVSRLAGISSRGKWGFEVESLLDLVKAAAANPDLLAYLKADEVQIGKEVRAKGERFKVPGIRVNKSSTLSVRS